MIEFRYGRNKVSESKLPWIHRRMQFERPNARIVSIRYLVWNCCGLIAGCALGGQMCSCAENHGVSMQSARVTWNVSSAPSSVMCCCDVAMIMCDAISLRFCCDFV